jgi:hypothetical protein
VRLKQTLPASRPGPEICVDNNSQTMDVADRLDLLKLTGAIIFQGYVTL